jgi:hypothetical protein
MSIAPKIILRKLQKKKEFGSSLKIDFLGQPPRKKTTVFRAV